MTNDKRTEELLGYFDDCKFHLPFDHQEMIAEIRRRIEGPVVDEAFVEKWAEKWVRIAESIHEQSGDTPKFLKALHHCQDMLREAGVKVEEP